MPQRHHRIDPGSSARGSIARHERHGRQEYRHYSEYELIDTGRRNPTAFVIRVVEPTQLKKWETVIDFRVLQTEAPHGDVMATPSLISTGKTGVEVAGQRS